VFTCKKNGKKHVEAMKELAGRGSGLEEYMKEHARELYDESV
jgi:hypothetical protein